MSTKNLPPPLPRKGEVHVNIVSSFLSFPLREIGGTSFSLIS